MIYHHPSQQINTGRQEVVHIVMRIMQLTES